MVEHRDANIVNREHFVVGHRIRKIRRFEDFGHVSIWTHCRGFIGAIWVSLDWSRRADYNGTNFGAIGYEMGNILVFGQNFPC
jgi:hypothetical protein